MNDKVRTARLAGEGRRVAFICDTGNQTEEEAGFWRDSFSFLSQKGVGVHSIGKAKGLGEDTFISQSDLGQEDIIATHAPDWLDERALQHVAKWRAMTTPNVDHRALVAEVVRTGNQIDSYLRGNSVIGVISWTNVAPLNVLFCLACRHHGIRSVVAERSPIPDMIWIESEGLHESSWVWRNRDTLPHLVNSSYGPAGKHYLGRLQDNVNGFRMEGGSALGHAQGSDYALLLFDNIAYAPWLPTGYPFAESRYSFERCPFGAYTKVKEICARSGLRLVTRIHPSCELSADLIERAGGEVDKRASLRSLLQHAKIVIAFLTKSSFASLALGKPTVVVGPNIAAVTSECWAIDNLGGLQRAICRVSCHQVPPPSGVSFINLLGWLGTEYFYGRCNRAAERLAYALGVLS